ncbi:MAG: pyridoxamine 5'-phosphate oxidase family protein [bacterium]
MKKLYDEPLYTEKQNEKIADETIQNEIKKILLSQSFAVLSTQGNGQPFSSLITYVCSEDFKKIIFATPLATRKFDLISKCGNVSIMVDTRSSNPESINEINAITIIGNAKIAEDNQDKLLYATMLIKSHPYLETFVKSSSTAIIAVDIEKYFYVRKFQEVIEWNPN